MEEFNTDRRLQRLTITKRKITWTISKHKLCLCSHWLINHVWDKHLSCEKSDLWPRVTRPSSCRGETEPLSLSLSLWMYSSCSGCVMQRKVTFTPTALGSWCNIHKLLHRRHDTITNIIVTASIIIITAITSPATIISNTTKVTITLSSSPKITSWPPSSHYHHHNHNITITIIIIIIPYIITTINITWPLLSSHYHHDHHRHNILIINIITSLPPTSPPPPPSSSSHYHHYHHHYMVMLWQW